MAAEKTKRGGSGKKILAAAVLGVIAGMLLAPKAGKELRKDLKKIAQKMEKEVIKRAGKTRRLTKKKYDEIVEAVANSYAKAKKIREKDVKAVVRDLKKIWVDLSRRLK